MDLRGIKIIFGDEEYHTGRDLDLVQEVKKLGKPEVQTYKVEVPGRNGLLNLTKSLTGKVNYNNRSLEFQYFGTGSRSRLLELDDIFSRYHGETIRIIDDDYPSHYFEGEVEVETEVYGTYVTIKMTVDANPFKLKSQKTKRSVNISGETVITLENEFMPVVPTITVSAETTITFGDHTTKISAGTYNIDAFELKAGSNVFTVTGSGTITFEYQEGAI